MEYWIGLLHQSALMFAARTTLPHFSVSSAMSLPKSAGEPASAVPPRSASFASSLGSARAALISLLSLSTISAGVPLGTPRPNQALGSQSEYLPIPKGYVALTIPTSEQQGVADYIQPGDYISVIATVSSAGKVAAKTIFTQLHVIKVGMQGTTGSSSATSLTVVVTQC